MTIVSPPSVPPLGGKMIIHGFVLCIIIGVLKYGKLKSKKLDNSETILPVTVKAKR